MRSDSCPPFPLPIRDGHYEGMSIRDYFAGQAQVVELSREIVQLNAELDAANGEEPMA